MWKEAMWLGMPKSQLEKWNILEGDLTGRFAYYRCEIDAVHGDNLEIDITANSRYRLWVNGRPALSGPCKGDRHRYYYDTVDVSSYLVNGKNVLAIQVLYCNSDTAVRQTDERAAIYGVVTPGGGHRLAVEGNMDINQFAVYQMKNIPQTRQMRFRAYETLQKSGVQVRYEHYEQVYISRMQREDTPGSIRSRLKQKLPKNFKGHSISVSDVLVLNHEGEVIAYYVEKEGFKVIAGFIRNGSSGSLLNFETTDFHIEGKAGSWLVLDTIIIEGREFFLMEHESYRADAAYVVLDADGKVVADDNRNGFDDYTKQQLKDYVHPQEPIPVPPIPAQKLSLENWQKYLENGEYLRSAEMSEEQNYNMIDGRNNNTAPKKGRSSVLAKLHQKQREIAKWSNQPLPDRSVAEDMERRKE